MLQIPTHAYIITKRQNQKKNKNIKYKYKKQEQKRWYKKQKVFENK